jgi:S1-C subfamily serine protease
VRSEEQDETEPEPSRERGGWLGVVIRDLAPQGLAGRPGTEVIEVMPDSPAAAAGLRVGDVLRSIDGHQLGGASDLVRYMRRVPPGVAVHLEVDRDGQVIALEVVPGPR